MSDFDGKIEIVLQEKDNNTIINNIYYEGVSKVSPTMHLDNEKIPCYFLMHLGGGFIEGESCSTYIELKENSRCILTTQAPTIIYKSTNGNSSKQTSLIKLEKNSVLEYMLDNTILFKDAIYEQNTDIHMDETSTLIYTDGITSGWSPNGEKFKYNLVSMKTRLFINGEIKLLDNLILDPKNNDLEGLGFFEGYANYGTAIIIDRRIDQKFVEKLREVVDELKLDINFGISLLETNGLVIRVIGNLTQHIHKAIYACTNYARKELLNSGELCFRKY